MSGQYVISLMQSDKPLKDALLPFHQRAGYANGTVPILPIILYRILGTYTNADDKDLYQNELYEFDEECVSSSVGYVKIEHSIPMPQHDEISPIVSQLGVVMANNVPQFYQRIEQFIIHALFPSSPFNLNIALAFKEIIELYEQNEPHLNPSKVENFSMKLLAWLNRYYPLLFPQETLSSQPPKLLYYGNIKSHEAYFLLFIAKIGVDVLYVHTDKAQGGTFEQIERVRSISKKIELPDSLPLEPFPITYKRVRKATVAYQATKELDYALYGEDVGVFRTRQYETGTTKALTLKATHDELKLYWNEEAKVRLEFKVKNQTVYVPNLFVKVSGTPTNLESYWDEIYELAEAEHTLLLKHPHFTQPNYTRQELYATAFLFGQDGLVDKEKLRNHSIYRLQHLNDSIQNFIIDKINELIQSDMFTVEMDLDFKLKILTNVITMDAQFLRLIEAFDYTGKVPKLIIYDSKKETFRESDIILLSFFNIVGADVAIYTPTNYNNIEHWIYPKYFDVHQLPSVQFDLDIPEKRSKKSFFKRLFQF